MLQHVSNIKTKDDIITFDLNNQSNKIKISLVNALRRTIISDIETYIINPENIKFIENNSMLNNEFLKHRLTLIPIISNITNLDYEKIFISCKKKNDSENMMSVYVSDFVCKNMETNEIIDNNVLFKYPKILFSKMNHNEYISFEAGIIKKNACHGGAFFSSVSKCVYTFKIDEKKANEIMTDLDEEKKMSFMNQDIERVYEKNEMGEPNVYHFVVESIGFYEPSQIIQMGIECLIKRLNNIKEEFNQYLHSNKKNKIQLKDINTDTDNEKIDFFNFIIDGENETVGNVLSTYLTYHENVSYCGFVIEHPLKKNILLKIKLKNDNNIENIIATIEGLINEIINILNEIYSTF